MHRVERGVLRVDDRVGEVLLEALQTHDLLLERLLHEEAGRVRGRVRARVRIRIGVRVRVRAARVQ